MIRHQAIAIEPVPASLPVGKNDVPYGFTYSHVSECFPAFGYAKRDEVRTFSRIIKIFQAPDNAASHVG